jgi:hypothetical protein
MRVGAALVCAVLSTGMAHPRGVACVRRRDVRVSRRAQVTCRIHGRKDSRGPPGRNDSRRGTAVRRLVCARPEPGLQGQTCALLLAQSVAVFGGSDSRLIVLASLNGHVLGQAERSPHLSNRGEHI